ncbi:MAG TPA: hypothetical protein VK612_02810 [Pyrinomonadaceae bacterium]|nr:hypothetical protein [Pyrinomonadaceae bacterium]
MKKFLVVIIALFVFSVTLPMTADAQSCRRYSRKKSNVSRSYRSARNYQVRGASYQRPSFYRRHRNVINMGIGAGGGMLLGGLLGGRRGAGWGALAGLGGSALYTYKIRPKQRRYYR